MDIGSAAAFIVLSLMLCMLALSVRYAVTQQHVWRDEHRIMVPR